MIRLLLALYHGRTVITPSLTRNDSQTLSAKEKGSDVCSAMTTNKPNGVYSTQRLPVEPH